MESACKQPSYVSSKMLLTNTAAIAAYEKTRRGIFIYKYAEFYCRVSIIDSGWGGGGGGSVAAPFLILKSTLGECPNKFL